MSQSHKAPPQVHQDTAFQAMVHFLALQWLSDPSASDDVRRFILSISDKWDGPATAEIQQRFAEALDDAWNREEPVLMRRS